jgi:hypothetical protein
MTSTEVAMTKAQGAARKTLARRAVLLSAGLLPTAGIISGLSRATAATDWANYTSPDSGASIRYPASWAVSAHANVNLLYPHQSLAVRSAAAPSRSAEDFPDLSSYSTRGVYLWLLHYDGLHQDCPPFQALTSHTRLKQQVSEFGAFSRYGVLFSGSRRSFILRLWIGRAVSQDSISLLDKCLSSLSLP